MSVAVPASPNPRRVAAGRRNSRKSRGLTLAGREILRQTARRNQPWRLSTGPRTPEGKAQMALNGKKCQLGPRSIREIRAELADLPELLRDLQARRQLVEGILARPG